MDKIPVTITIRSRQALDGETIRADQEAEGTLTAVDTGWQLRYREPAEQDELPVENHLLLEKNSALLERCGGIASQMRFQPGETTAAPYRTPYGALDLSVTTEYLGHTVTSDGGKVMIRYGMSAQGQTMGRYTLQLNIRKKDD